jgi:hypothetical protein
MIGENSTFFLENPWHGVKKSGKKPLAKPSWSAVTVFDFQR